MTFEQWWKKSHYAAICPKAEPDNEAYLAAQSAWDAARYEYQVAKTTAPEALRSGWVSVEERLPELKLYPKDQKDPEDYDWWRSWSVFCAVTTPDGKREVRKGMYYKTPDGVRWETDYGQWDAEGIVTHWQERPDWPALPETIPSPLAPKRISVPERMFAMESAREDDGKETKLCIAARNYLRRTMLEASNG